MLACAMPDGRARAEGRRSTMQGCYIVVCNLIVPGAAQLYMLEGRERSTVPVYLITHVSSALSGNYLPEVQA